MNTFTNITNFKFHALVIALSATSVMITMPNNSFAQAASSPAAVAELPEIDASKYKNGPLNLAEIRELFTGKKLTGTAFFQGNVNNDTYVFNSVGTAKNRTMRGTFEAFAGEGTWTPRNFRNVDSMCWDIRGTWQNYSCFPVEVKDGKIKFDTWFIQK